MTFDTSTILGTAHAIRALGLTAVWLRDYDEWRVNYLSDDSRFNGDYSAYYTNSNRDALMTARSMSAFKK